jgi:hypothetical protein
MPFVKMDPHILASPRPCPLNPLIPILPPFAFFRFFPEILIDTSTIRNAPNPLLCNTDSRSNRQKLRIPSPRFSNTRRTYTKVRRSSSAVTKNSISNRSVRIFTVHRSLVTDHQSRLRAFLIVNMIIRIAPKPFVFSTYSISNRQYSGALTRLAISPLPRPARKPSPSVLPLEAEPAAPPHRLGLSGGIMHNDDRSIGSRAKAILALGCGISLGILGLAAYSDHIDASATAATPPPSLPGAAWPSAGPNGWQLGKPITYENIAIFPVTAAREADTSAFETLDEGLASGDVIITEQANAFRRSRDGRPRPIVGGQVNQLALINRGKRPLLLLAGEVVSGGKQDRIIGKDRIVPVGSEPLPLDVFCVEHGRWTGATEQFSAANTMVKPSVRKEAAVDQDQNKVWAAVRGDTPPGAFTEGGPDVSPGRAAGVAGGVPSAAPPRVSADSLQAVMVTEAPTESYKKIYESARVSASVESYVREIQRRFQRETKGERVVGVVVAYGSEVAWSDIFASSELFDTYWPKLLRSYVTEALTRSGTREIASIDEAREFLLPADGHVQEEVEPDVYRWTQQSAGGVDEIQIEALRPKSITLHWLRVLRTD